MVSFTVRMRFDPNDHHEIEQMLRHLTAASRQEPGCVNYVAHFLDGDPSTVVLYEQYTDEAALDHHRNTPHFHEFAIAGLYQRMLGSRELENLIAVS